MKQMWDKKEIYDEIDMPYGYNKPDGAMLIYPVVSGTDIRHEGSFKNLFMTETPTEEQLAMASLENNVSEKSSPIYMMHTSNDGAVNVRNSLVLADALAKQGIKFELHVYPDAPHGIALANGITSGGLAAHEDKEIAKWVESAVRWAENL